MFVANLLNISRRSACFYALMILLAANLLQTVYAVFFCGFIQADDVEHLHAAFFVANGEVPYRDFFEHHHPLLWYLLAPIVKILPHHTIIALYVGRLISLFVSLIGGYYIYKIEKKFLGDTICALICFNLYFWGITDVSAAGLFNIKPDIYMRCCFLIGLYHLLCYFQTMRFKDLQICTLLFTVCFFFLQTAALTVAPLVLPIGYFLYKNPQRYKDFLKAAIIPLMLLALAVWGIFYIGIWQIYWQTNWFMNSLISRLLYLHPHLEHLLPCVDILFIVIWAIGYYIFCSKFNIYILSITALFVHELCIRLFFNTTHMHYLTPLLLYAAMTAAPFIREMMKKYKLSFYAFMIISLLHLSVNIVLTPRIPLVPEEYRQKTIGLSGLFSHYKPHLSYYWMYQAFEGLDDAFFHRYSDYDINRLYREAQPEIFMPSGEGVNNALKIIKALQLNDEQSEILLRHISDVEKIGGYIEIEENIYQRADTIQK